jgi:hypothetical protein
MFSRLIIAFCISDILAQGAAAADQVAGQVPDQEHERADGRSGEARSVPLRGEYILQRYHDNVIFKT